ncbi:MAG: hypothetical protein KDJ69_00440 [Nitratireductor sp.]|nr:hypothetical protein [Nitratireductor sp.]
MTRQSASGNGAYRRVPGFIAREVGGEIFLLDNAHDKIDALDITSSAIWRFLEAPQTLDDCLEIFSVAFPDMNSAKLKRMISHSLEQMESAGLIFKSGRIN